MTDRDTTFYQLPAVMPIPHRPQSEEDLHRWAKEIHDAIYDNYIPQTDRIENMIMIGQTLEERPPAVGSRRFFYHIPADAEDDAVLYLDVRYGGRNYWDTISLSEVAEGFTKASPIVDVGDSIEDEAMREFAIADSMPNKYLTYVSGVLDLMELHDTGMVKRYEKQFNYTGSVLDTIVLTRMSDSETWTKTLTYVGGVLEEIEAA
jgi:hypothetical protein